MGLLCDITLTLYQMLFRNLGIEFFGMIYCSFTVMRSSLKFFYLFVSERHKMFIFSKIELRITKIKINISMKLHLKAKFYVTLNCATFFKLRTISITLVTDETKKF